MEKIKKIKKHLPIRIYDGRAVYYVIHNIFSGRKNRYDVLVDTVDDPVVIGRELPIKICKKVIARFDKFAETYEGTRIQALKIAKKCINVPL